MYKSKLLIIAIFIITICSLLLIGCSANTYVYDKNEKLLYHIKSEGSALHKLETPDGYKIETDSKMKSPFEGIVKAVGQEVTT